MGLHASRLDFHQKSDHFITNLTIHVIFRFRFVAATKVNYNKNHKKKTLTNFSIQRFFWKIMTCEFHIISLMTIEKICFC